MALAMAAGGGTMGTSPTPRTPKGWPGLGTSTITVSVLPEQAAVAVEIAAGTKPSLHFKTRKTRKNLLFRFAGFLFLSYGLVDKIKGRDLPSRPFVFLQLVRRQCVFKPFQMGFGK